MEVHSNDRKLGETVRDGGDYVDQCRYTAMTGDYEETADCGDQRRYTAMTEK